MLVMSVIGLFLVVLLVWAVRSRVSLKRMRSSSSTMDNTVASPASIALGELIAIAGGIYLSLILLTSFLKLTVPEQISILDTLKLDPIALVAILIALLQPIFLSIWRRVKN